MEKVALFLLDKYAFELITVAAIVAAIFFLDCKTRIRVPALHLPDNTVELIKWVGLVFMTGDHVNKFLLSDTYSELYNCGRVVMPLFAFVLAYNLARPGVTNSPNIERVLKRLFLFASISTVPFIVLGVQKAGWWPLNILFTLLFSAICIKLFSAPSKWYKVGGVIFFIASGILSEFWWPAMLLSIGAFFWIKTNKNIYLLLVAIAFLLLSVINMNHWALVAIPVVIFARYIPIRIPRLQMFFYFYYPAHLTVIYFIKMVMQ